MTYRYLEIDEDGYIIGESFLTGEVEDDRLILVDLEFDSNNKRYVNGEWVDYIYEPVPFEPQPSQLDRIETALNLLTGDSVSTTALNEAINEGVNDV